MADGTFEEARFRFAAAPEGLAAGLDFVAETAAALGLDEAAAARLSVAVDELAANALTHGGLTATQEIELRLASGPGGPRLTLIDPGPPFDPVGRPPEPPRELGGLGLLMVRELMRELRYERRDGLNVVEMRPKV